MTDTTNDAVHPLSQKECPYRKPIDAKARQRLYQKTITAKAREIRKFVEQRVAAATAILEKAEVYDGYPLIEPILLNALHDVRGTSVTKQSLRRNLPIPKQATIADFRHWLRRDLGHFLDLDDDLEDHVRVWQDKEDYFEFSIFTEEHEFRFDVRDPAPDDPDGYLGCIALLRKIPAGEDWLRTIGKVLHEQGGGPPDHETWHDIISDLGAGRICADLEEGSLSYETWAKILGDIVSLEMVPVQQGMSLCKECEGSGIVPKTGREPVAKLEDV